MFCILVTEAVTWGCVRACFSLISGTWLSPRAWLDTEQGPQGSVRSTRPDRVQEVFGKCSQAHGVTPGVSCVRPGTGLSEPDQFLPTRDNLCLSNVLVNQRALKRHLICNRLLMVLFDSTLLDTRTLCKNFDLCKIVNCSLLAKFYLNETTLLFFPRQPCMWSVWVPQSPQKHHRRGWLLSALILLA